MTEFFYFLLNYAREGLILAVLAVILGALLLVPWYLSCRKRQKPFPWGKAVLILALLGYGVVVFSVTLLDRFAGYGQYANFHLFRAWLEAWNNFSQRNWLNVLLNVAMFVPLGLLLPLLHRRLRHWYVPLLAGLGFSLFIEVTQYVTSAGLFDVDDLFCNTLGAFLGGCVILAILSRKPGKIVAWLLAPAAFCLAVGGIFLTYRLQPYGNLILAPAYRVSTGDVTWTLSTELSQERPTVEIFRSPTFTRDSADQFGADFFRERGWTIRDRSYYDGAAVYQDPGSPGGSLLVNYTDRSYVMTDWALGEPKRDCTREEVLEALAPFRLDIPPEAAFSPEENGSYLLTLSQLHTDRGMYDGTVSCTLDHRGTVRELHQFLIHYEAFSTAEIRSQQEAWEQLQKGWFSGPEWFPGNEPDCYEITGVRLEYRIDSKGFYRPVYLFDALVDGQPIGGGLLVLAQ